LPQHKLADMHGLVRAVVRTQTRLQVNSIMSAHGLDIPPSFWIAGIWSASKSLREWHVTDGYNGRVFVCGLWDLYVDEGKYEHLLLREEAVNAKVYGPDGRRRVQDTDSRR
jgi:hypothetical protein